MSAQLKIVFAAGGTAGHVNPALAVASDLQESGCTVAFAGTPGGMEQTLVEAAGLSFMGFEVRGLNRRQFWTWPSTMRKLQKTRKQARDWLIQEQPTVVATFGGYASLPIGMAASQLGIPLLIHEQNARVGLANRLLAKKAEIIALSDIRAENALKQANKQAKVVLTGNPLRATLFGHDRLSARKSLGLDGQGRVLLIFGGSLGARHLNNALLAQANSLLSDYPDLQVLHITGALDYADIVADWQSQYAHLEAKERWHLMPYCHDMGAAYAASDLVVARAGATTLAELTALGKAALLVPYPFSAADEQTANAEALALVHAAEVWPDNRLHEDGFIALLHRLLDDNAMRERMENAALSLGKPDACAALARLIRELGEAGKP